MVGACKEFLKIKIEEFLIIRKNMQIPDVCRYLGTGKKSDIPGKATGQFPGFFLQKVQKSKMAILVHSFGIIATMLNSQLRILVREYVTSKYDRRTARLMQSYKLTLHK